MTKYTYLNVLQQYTDYGWEDLCASESSKEIRDNRKDYRKNAPMGVYRIINRRELRVKN